MKIIDHLKNAMYEDANDFLEDEFHVISDKSSIMFNGKLSYTGDSEIKLQLIRKMPDTINYYVSDQSFSELSEQQFKDASEKVQNALKESLDQIELLLKNKLASYGLVKGETNG